LNSGGYPASGGIFMSSSTVYRFVELTSASVTVWTIDGIYGSGSGSLIGGALFTLTGTTINNQANSRVCISATPCTAALALLDLAGSSSGQAFLLRIDDAVNHPGINFYGSGNSLGGIEATSGGLQLLSGDLFSQVQVASGTVTIENMNTSGATLINVVQGDAQGAGNFMNFITAGGVTEAFVDVNGGFGGALFNASNTAAAVTFQNSNSLFSVNGFGDLTANGQINVIGTNDTVNGGFNAAIKVAGMTIVDNIGNATFSSLTCTGSPCGSGGGGGGSPGGLTTNVQYNNAGSFGGSANFTWANTSQLLTVTAASSSVAGIAVANGFIQSAAGFLATTASATEYNSIQAAGGGMAAKSFTATGYVQTGSGASAPSPTAGDTFNPGTLYWNTGSAAEQVWNGSAWVSLGGGTGSPGGSSTDVQFNSSGSFAGSGNFTWNNSAQTLTILGTSSSVAGLAVGTGYIQADGGFLATSGTATNYNAIQAPGGGLAGKSFTATKYVQTGSGASAPSPTAGDTFNPGALYWNTASGQEQVFNGSAWVNLSGAGGSPGGSNTNVQFNSSGGFGGSNNLTYVGQLLTSVAPSSGAPGMYVQTGYIQADSGFLATTATAVQYNSIQAPGGGILAKSLRASNYIQSGNSSGVPATTSGDSFQPGALYFNTSLGAEQVFNGGSWVSLSGGGGGGVTSLSGTTNQVNVSASTGAVTVSLPQAICTGCAPTFAGLTSTGAITAPTMSLNQSSLGTILNIPNATGFNSIATTGGYNADSAGGSSSAFAVNSTSVINSSGQYVGAINSSLASTFNSGVTFNGGISLNFASNSTIYVGSSGNFYQRYLSGPSTAVSCGGISNGWEAVATDDYLVICVGGSRFRAALTSF
jgi:hypothetical protein